MIPLNYLNDQLASLTDNEKEELFVVLTEHKDLFNKLLPNIPLLMYIADPASGVHPVLHGPIIQSYKVWSQTQ